MARNYEIDSAWRASIRREPNGRQTVKTETFVSELAKVNFEWSYRQANQWIETYLKTFQQKKGKVGLSSFSTQTEGVDDGICITGYRLR